MQMSQPSVLFAAGNLISSCGATIQSRWNVKNVPTRRRMGGVCCRLNAKGEVLVSNTFQSQTSLSLQLRHLSQVTRFLFFPKENKDQSTSIAFIHHFIMER